MSEVPPPPSRREFITGVGTLSVIGVAGCSGSNPDSESPPSEEPTSEEPTSSTKSLTPSSVETLVSIPGDPVPENLAYGPDEELYFGITAGELRRVTSDQLGARDLALADTEQVASLPGAIGVETAPDGTAYVAVASQDDSAGVWSVTADGAADQLVSISGFPNDILFDADRDRLLVTESQGGVIYSVTTDGTRSTWLDDDRLSTEGFGANGLTLDTEGNLYVAVTQTSEETGRLLEVPVTADGGAGEPTVLSEGETLLGADGITARDEGIYVAVNSQNLVVQVSPDGSTTTVADEDDGLVFPSDVTFGSGQQREKLFVCDFANQSSEDGAILRAEF
ncbi:SMP-30/gluconolactonase/LRE family protein [Halorubrum sp. SD626R]|uniref:SMP-30/gluconolactonase/LRE family protein n=1 Tax=Halorubrum sp. SD626R TaxID=1419722 RepID=UPI000A8B4E1E|nr:SMP-30/gluconolactonase/LRE family protein [Halorubrum sp. SD626R]TKX81240.1 hypothetical protein EXE53_05835 [Halorubrum sp. SD626R]